MKPSNAAIVAVFFSSLLAAGCAYYPTFSFPVEEGDIETGRQAFIDHRCHLCHTVADTRLPEPAGDVAPLLELGGETRQVKAYSDLVTSIINPDHRISDEYREQLQPPLAPDSSPMPMAHIDNMTIRELIDIVVFLDSRYVVLDDYEELAAAPEPD